MKVVLSGAQCTGKTTLLNYLFGNYQHIRDHFLKQDEVVRNLKKEYNIKINQEGNDETQLLITNNHLLNLLNKHNIITDRGLLDSTVYGMEQYPLKLSRWVYDYQINIFRNYIFKYDLIFYIKPEFDIESDGVRSMDLNYRNEIMELFEHLIEKYNIKVIRLSGTIKERADKIFKEIIECKNCPMYKNKQKVFIKFRSKK